MVNQVDKSSYLRPKIEFPEEKISKSTTFPVSRVALRGIQQSVNQKSTKRTAAELFSMIQNSPVGKRRQLPFVEFQEIVIHSKEATSAQLIASNSQVIKELRIGQTEDLSLEISVQYNDMLLAIDLYSYAKNRSKIFELYEVNLKENRLVAKKENGLIIWNFLLKKMAFNASQLHEINLFIDHVLEKKKIKRSFFLERGFARLAYKTIDKEDLIKEYDHPDLISIIGFECLEPEKEMAGIKIQSLQFKKYECETSLTIDYSGLLRGILEDYSLCWVDSELDGSSHAWCNLVDQNAYRMWDLLAATLDFDESQRVLIAEFLAG